MLRLAVKLWSYLGVGYRWTMNLWRLIIYAMLLLPGFLQMIVFYFFSPRVIRNVAYGRGPRQMLDWYLPKQSTPGQQHPVVIFVTGGAWTIGYKAWGALLSERLSAAGVLVACLDYRNFPQQGNALDMLQDVNTGISWVCRRCGMHRGDPDNVVLVGQSAGGQLGALALMRQQMASGLSSEQAYPPWNPADVRAFISISGAYDMAGLAEHLHKRGLYRNLFDQIMSLGGTPSMDKLSPQCVASSWGKAAAPAVFMPPVMLVHGTADKSVPSTQAQALHTALVESGVDSTCRLVDHATHTVFLLEGPMRGGKDPLMALMLPVIYGLKASSEPGSDSPPPFPTTYRQLCPAVLCHLAGLVCPF
ncbi:Alpha/Beta hydrolase protein [Haematococcus lacustris]